MVYMINTMANFDIKKFREEYTNLLDSDPEYFSTPEYMFGKNNTKIISDKPYDKKFKHSTDTVGCVLSEMVNDIHGK